MAPRLVLLLSLLSVLAQASTTVDQPFPVRVQNAHRIVRAKVLRNQVVMESPKRIYTLSALEVLETLKGPRAKTLEVVQLGGKSGEWEVSLPGTASMVPGEESLFLLRCTDKAHPDRCGLYALGEGRLPITSDKCERAVLVPGEGKRPLPAVVADVKATLKKSQGKTP